MTDVPLSLGSRTIPIPQLPVSYSNSSQGLHRSSPLTNSLTQSPTNSLYSTALIELGWLRNIASEWTTQKPPPPTVPPLLRAGRCLATIVVSLFRSRCLATAVYATILMRSPSWLKGRLSCYATVRELRSV
jgi:hypothetical protein